MGTTNAEGVPGAIRGAGVPAGPGTGPKVEPGTKPATAGMESSGGSSGERAAGHPGGAHRRSAAAAPQRGDRNCGKGRRQFGSRLQRLRRVGIQKLTAAQATWAPPARRQRWAK